MRLHKLCDAAEDLDSKTDYTGDKMVSQHYHTSIVDGTGRSDEERNIEFTVIANQAAIILIFNFSLKKSCVLKFIFNVLGSFQKSRILIIKLIVQYFLFLTPIKTRLT